EVEVLHLAHERDRVARDATAEAFVDTQLGVHVEGGGLLLVERAEPAVPPTDTLECQVLADEGDEVGGVPDSRHVLVEDAHCGRGYVVIRRRAAGLPAASRG